jgi:phage-related protein
MPYVKKLGNGLMELRVRGGQEVRIFYVLIHSSQAFLLHGFIKKSQATPKRALILAHRRQKEVETM